MRSQPVLPRQRTHGLQVGERQHTPAVGVFHHDETRAGVVRVLRLDSRADIVQCERAVGLVRQGLGLNAAKHRHAARLPAVGVPELTDDGLIAAAAVPE